MRVRDLFADCTIRLEPVYLGWRVFLVAPDGEWFEHFDTRDKALTSAAIWAELADTTKHHERRDCQTGEGWKHPPAGRRLRRLRLCISLLAS